ncbi:MAG TPA: DUF6259 domain-containing protein, partial [Candidatus Sumerlaeota bacterium]|nr:DUF6259 domain-containing protein [Candidatus Sumerlaeota bacterium]
GSNILSTSIPGASTLEIPVHQAASEIYFVLGAFLPARENPSNENIIAQVDESERFLVELCYADGTRREYFPLDISAGLHKIPNMTFSACAVPADMTRPLACVRLHDRSDGGLFALAALTLNLTTQPFFDQAFAISPAKPLPILTQPPFRAPECVYDKGVLVLRNTFFEYTFDCSEGLILSSWVNAWTGRNLPGKSFDGRFFSGTMDGQPFTSRDFLVGDFFVRNGSGESTATLHMRWKNDSVPISAVFTAALDHSCEARFHLSLINDGDTSHTFEILLPDLPEIVLSDDPTDTHYAFPGLPFQSGNLMVDVEKPYSGQFPGQFMDLYNPAEGWGVCLMTRDLDLLTKYYRLRKKADGVSSLSVRYPTLPSVGLPARGRMETAPFTLAVHGGDWHEGLRAYQRWVSSWYAPVSPRQKWFQDLYTCRRDYPVGGSGYLFDRSRNTYTFPVEFDNAEKHLGGPDMLDISSWGWSAAYGRVGEYRRYELGGLANFRSAIAFAHGKGIPVGLYIEGYLLDERCTIFGEKGGEWKMLNADGSDQRSGREVTICPSVPEWQDWMARLYADVLRETDAAALYIDQFGMAWPTRRCYHPGHSHPPGESPLRGEVEMARKIRAAVSAVRSGVPLYVEYTPVDAAIRNLDGSFAYTTWYGEDVLSPTRTTISRFCFPDFRQFELVHGQFLARNWTEEGLKKAFFNGQGLWIKGDLGSWYDARTRLFDRRSRAVFLEHRDAFTSTVVEPFLPVLKERVFAH